MEYKRSDETDLWPLPNVNQGYRLDRTATITGLDADTSYQVRVRATGEGTRSHGRYVGTGSTNKEGNSPPTFKRITQPTTRDEFENTSAGEDIGSPGDGR